MAKVCYTKYCRDEQVNGAFCFLSAVNLHNIYCGQSAPYLVDSRPAVHLDNDGKPGKGRFFMSCNLISTKIVESELDILELGIVDFDRLNGHFSNQREALCLAGFLLMDLARITVVEVDDFWDIPNRDDFPGWRHVGHHPKVGKQFWNWFHHHNPDSELYLADGPDLCGIVNGALFFGDIGKVSASTFIMSLKSMGLNDVWISVSLDGTRQTIIEYVAGGRQYTPSERPIFIPPAIPDRPKRRIEPKPFFPKQYYQPSLFEPVKRSRSSAKVRG